MFPDEDWLFDADADDLFGYSSGGGADSEQHSLFGSLFESLQLSLFGGDEYDYADMLLDDYYDDDYDEELAFYDYDDYDDLDDYYYSDVFDYDEETDDDADAGAIGAWPQDYASDDYGDGDDEDAVDVFLDNAPSAVNSNAVDIAGGSQPWLAHYGPGAAVEAQAGADSKSLIQRDAAETAAQAGSLARISNTKEQRQEDVAQQQRKAKKSLAKQQQQQHQQQQKQHQQQLLQQHAAAAASSTATASTATAAATAAATPAAAAAAPAAAAAAAATPKPTTKPIGINCRPRSCLLHPWRRIIIDTCNKQAPHLFFQHGQHLRRDDRHYEEAEDEAGQGGLEAFPLHLGVHRRLLRLWHDGEANADQRARRRRRLVRA